MVDRPALAATVRNFDGAQLLHIGFVLEDKGRLSFLACRDRTADCKVRQGLPANCFDATISAVYEEGNAEQMDMPAKTCPKCGSEDYTFRSRKKIEATEGQEAAVETKYRCRGCGHEWKVRVATRLE